MEELLRWMAGGDAVPGSSAEMRWAWVTVALSVAVAAGYAVIAVKRHLQAGLPDRGQGESKAALSRLRNIVLCSAALGTAFCVTDMFWLAWRLYDVVLFGLAVHTWSFALRMRGLGAVEERLRHVGELERSVAKYREIAESLPQPVWTATADGRVDFSNRRWLEFVGPGRAWTEAVHPDDAAEVHAWWAAAVANPRPLSRELRLGSPESGYHTFLLQATPAGHGNSLKWLGACADIEDQKRLVAEKESQGKRKLFFLNALSHDLRAPLNNVALNAHLLKTAVRGEAEAESAKAIADNVAAAGDLVTRLLDFARIDGQEENTLARVDLSSVLRHVVRRFVPVAGPKGLSLSVVAPDGLSVVTDRQKFERIVSNLVDNAIKFTPDGGVTVELLRAGAGVTLRVIDTGVGVSDADAGRLFDEFYQAGERGASELGSREPAAREPGRERRKGFGMGLAICRTLARQLGGDARLDQTGQAGTTFEVTLHDFTGDPRAPHEDAPAGPASTHTGAQDLSDAPDADVCFG